VIILIENYKIINVCGEKRLILFLNLNYEFGGKKDNIKNFKQMIKDYINDNKIRFYGGIITFVVGGIMIGNVIFNNNEFKDYKSIDSDYSYISYDIVQKIASPAKVEEDVVEKIILNDKDVSSITKTQVNNNVQNIKSEKAVVNPPNNAGSNGNKNDKSSEMVDIIDSHEEEIIDNNIYVNLKKKDGSVVKIELEEYLVGVVGAEMPALFNVEALKAQAIIARTYALKAISKGNILKDNETNQSYKTNNELKSMWGGNYDAYYNKVKEAVNREWF